MIKYLSSLYSEKSYLQSWNKGVKVIENIKWEGEFKILTISMEFSSQNQFTIRKVALQAYKIIIFFHSSTWDCSHTCTQQIRGWRD